jgi:hypothetical protein
MDEHLLRFRTLIVIFDKKGFCKSLPRADDKKIVLLQFRKNDKINKILG